MLFGRVVCCVVWCGMVWQGKEIIFRRTKMRKVSKFIVNHFITIALALWGYIWIKIHLLGIVGIVEYTFESILFPILMLIILGNFCDRTRVITKELLDNEISFLEKLLKILKGRKK